jgi:N-dimethylarginine dimethylaminohydrolase
VTTSYTSSEYGQLRVVIMRLAGEATLDLSNGKPLDPVLRRQAASARFEPFDCRRVRTQQRSLIELLEQRGIEVMCIGHGSDTWSQHYPRDLGFVVDDVFFVGRPNSRVRQRELVALEPVLRRLDQVVRLDGGTIEGGDVMLDADVVLVGLGEETSAQGVRALDRCLRRLGSSREVIPVRFARRGVIHLDTLFNIVAPGVALIDPSAFATPQMRWFEARYDLVEVTAFETRSVQINTLSLSPTEVVVDAGSKRIASELRRRGIEPVCVDYSEVTKVPGSFRCSTLPLLRERT